MERIRCISLWQPWATLLVCGRKRIETRHWSTNYVGPLLIHAAKRWTQDQRSFCNANEPHMDLLNSGFTGCHHAKTSLPLGAIVGILKLADCLPVEHESIKRQFSENENEPLYGNYSTGRFAWITKTPMCFDEPIPEVGRQGFWNVDMSRIPADIAALYLEKDLFF